MIRRVSRRLAAWLLAWGWWWLVIIAVHVVALIPAFLAGDAAQLHSGLSKLFSVAVFTLLIGTISSQSGYNLGYRRGYDDGFAGAIDWLLRIKLITFRKEDQN